ncbi:hypothetical protein Mapa_002548 [Marchantia paleacea]|nr:hypothetical protein Mapa_002548 [Marchantia paleacea]
MLLYFLFMRRTFSVTCTSETKILSRANRSTTVIQYGCTLEAGIVIPLALSSRSIFESMISTSPVQEKNFLILKGALRTGTAGGGCSISAGKLSTKGNRFCFFRSDRELPASALADLPGLYFSESAAIASISIALKLASHFCPFDGDSGSVDSAPGDSALLSLIFLVEVSSSTTSSFSTSLSLLISFISSTSSCAILMTVVNRGISLLEMSSSIDDST